MAEREAALEERREEIAECETALEEIRRYMVAQLREAGRREAQAQAEVAALRAQAEAVQQNAPASEGGRVEGMAGGRRLTRRREGGKKKEII